MANCVQWNPSKADTIGNQHFASNSKVSLTKGLSSSRMGVECTVQWAVDRNVCTNKFHCIFPVSIVLIIMLLSTTVATFSELSLGGEGQAEAIVL